MKAPLILAGVALAQLSSATVTVVVQGGTTTVAAGAAPATATSTVVVMATPVPAPATVKTSASAAAAATQSSLAGPVATAGMCGQGYTYCGYILKEQQGFSESEIIAAYCAASTTNCPSGVSGTTKTDPMEALYVCLPPTASPKEDVSVSSNKNNKKMSKRGRSFGGIRGRRSTGEQNIHHHFHMHMDDGAAAAADAKMVLMAGTATAEASSAAPTCASTPTTGNKLELLCACGGSCLNPAADHIGRCDAPCS